VASFATFQEAEQRAYAKRDDGTWINAHAERDSNGVIMVRFQRKMSPGAGLLNGGWVETSDNTVT
jgi:hypothetical protein